MLIFYTQKNVLKLHRFGIVYSLGPWFPCCGWCFAKIAMLRVQQPILKLCWFYNVFSLSVSSITFAITFWPRQNRIWLPLYSHCILSHHSVSIFLDKSMSIPNETLFSFLTVNIPTIPHYTPIMVIYFRQSDEASWNIFPLVRWFSQSLENARNLHSTRGFPR